MNDLRYALRQLRRRPGFTLATTLTLSLGIGATTAIFSIVNALLFRALPVSEPDRLVSVIELREGADPEFSLSLPEYLAYREAAAPMVELGAHHLSDVTLTFSGETLVSLGLDVSGNYFDMLGIRPAAGRFFGEEEARTPGAVPVVVISHELWQTRFGGAPDAIAGTLTVNGHPLTIVGVAPEGFHGTMLGARPTVWLPLGLQELIWPDRDLLTWGRSRWLGPIGRLAPGVKREAAEATLGVIARRLAATHEYPQGAGPDAVVLRSFNGLPPGLRSGVSGFLGLLQGTAGLVLLIAAVNVAGMLLARAAARRREFAVRQAVGARARHVSRQLVVEGVALALLGGVGSVLVALWTGGLVRTIQVPGAGALVLDPSLDLRVLGVVAAVSLLTGIGCGLVPALKLTARGRLEGLHEAGRGATGGTRLRSGLVVAQIALSMVLLIGAGLFVRTFRSALDIEHGFDPEGVIAFELSLRMSGHDEAEGRAFYAELLERLQAAPEVESAALATIVPLHFSWDQTRMQVPGHEPPSGTSGFAVGFNMVSPEYFGTVKMPILEGRGFSEEDRDGPPVIVVNRTLADRFFPGGQAVGQTVRFSGQDARIIGVVPDGKYQSFSEAPTLYAYVPSASGYSPEMWLQVRTHGDAAAAVAAVRRELRGLDPGVAPVTVAPLETLLGGSLFPQRMAAGLIGLFGALGLILAAVGVFGVLSYQVVQRTRELGIRFALGATRQDVLGLVLRGGIRLLAFGIGLGLVGALATTRLLTGLLHGISPTDPLTFVAVAGLLGLTVVLAAWLPARRAARIDPMEALRHE